MEKRCSCAPSDVGSTESPWNVEKMDGVGKFRTR